jgi:hypothetical protein
VLLVSDGSNLVDHRINPEWILSAVDFRIVHDRVDRTIAIDSKELSNLTMINKVVEGDNTCAIVLSIVFRYLASNESMLIHLFCTRPMKGQVEVSARFSAANVMYIDLNRRISFVYIFAL